MNKFNPFHHQSTLYPFRWFIALALASGTLMGYHDLKGKGLFQFTNQQQWVSSGPGFHK